MREEQLRTYLKRFCFGRENAMKSAELQEVFHISETELRKQVNRLRRKGIPIGSDRSGYFYARTGREIYTTIHQFRVMIRGMEADIAGLEMALDSFCAGGDARE